MEQDQSKTEIAAAVRSSDLLDADAVYGKTQKGKDLEVIMREMEKMDAIPPQKQWKRKKQLHELTILSMDFIGKYGIHPVDLMKKCGFIESV